MSDFPAKANVAIHVRPFRDFSVKFKGTSFDPELERAVDSLVFVSFIDNGTEEDVEKSDEICEFFDSVISELDGKFVESTGYQWAMLTETLIIAITTAFEKLPAEIRSCSTDRLREFLKNYIGLEVFADFAEA